MTAATKTPATHASLEAALQAVRKDLGGIEKDGTAPEMLGSFKFVSWDALAPKVGDAMAKHDVFILPEVLDAVTVEAGQTARGKTNYRTTVRLRFEVIGGGHSKQILWFGQGDDTGDKSLQKAVTSGYKYFLLKLFLASGAEDSQFVEIRTKVCFCIGVSGSTRVMSLSPFADPALSICRTL